VNTSRRAQINGAHSPSCHSREGGNPDRVVYITIFVVLLSTLPVWIPAFAGMTSWFASAAALMSKRVTSRDRVEELHYGSGCVRRSRLQQEVRRIDFDELRVFALTKDFVATSARHYAIFCRSKIKQWSID
jgi:hypothetical protein